MNSGTPDWDHVWPLAAQNRCWLLAELRFSYEEALWMHFSTFPGGLALFSDDHTHTCVLPLLCIYLDHSFIHSGGWGTAPSEPPTAHRLLGPSCGRAFFSSRNNRDLDTITIRWWVALIEFCFVCFLPFIWSLLPNISVLYYYCCYSSLLHCPGFSCLLFFFIWKWNIFLWPVATLRYQCT